MRPSLMAVLALSLVACGGDDDASSNPDAGGADAAAGSCHVVFLNYGGVTLDPGPDNATSNTSSIVTQSATVPAFDSVLRQTALTDQIRSTLEPYDIDVVTTRPAAGSYQMVVFGGTPQDVGLSQGIGSVAPQSCSLNRLGVGLVFDVLPADADHDLANQAIAIIGIMNDVRTSNLPNDCMCYGGDACTGNPNACTIGGAGTPRNASDTCDNATEYDEAAAFAAALTCP